jgi:hypothetical protein
VDDSVVEQRIYEQAHRIRKSGAVTGWAALRWRGAAYFNGLTAEGERLPVPLVLGRQPLKADPRVAIDLSQIAPQERTITGGIRVATVQRALFDVMRYERALRLAVVAMDMVAAARLMSVSLMNAYILGRFAWTGVPRVRRALALASDESKSPQETLMRLVWVLDAQLPPPLCNRPVFSLHGDLLGYPDILDVEAGVVGEYDGQHHAKASQRRRDVVREEVFRDHGLEYFDVVSGDLRDRPLVVRRMHATRTRSRLVPEGKRRWTLNPPPGWRPREEPLDLHLLRTGEAAQLVRSY